MTKGDFSWNLRVVQFKKTNQVYYINRPKGKPYIFISINAQKAFDKTHTIP